MDKIQYSEKVDAVVYSNVIDGFTNEDFVQLALAALDQAGFPTSVTNKIVQLLDSCASQDGESKKYKR